GRKRRREEELCCCSTLPESGIINQPHHSWIHLHLLPLKKNKIRDNETTEAREAKTVGEMGGRDP
ncbi:unnamed protein product, partial [Brassica oleracea]